MKADNEKCFACDRRLDERFEYVLVAGESTTVPVGMNCYRKVKRFDRDGGYQPPKGGPRLVLIGSRG